jgi:hypothetical protein
MIDENLSRTAKVMLDNTEVGAPTADGTSEVSISEDVDAIDGCDVEVADKTADEDLPPTEGGVE